MESEYKTASAVFDAVALVRVTLNPMESVADEVEAMSWISVLTLILIVTMSAHVDVGEEKANGRECTSRSAILMATAIVTSKGYSCALSASVEEIESRMGIDVCVLRVVLENVA